MGKVRFPTWLPVALLAVGVVFHGLYVFSVITIYFQSPLVFGLSPYRGMTQEAPAKRLVLFVGMFICVFGSGIEQQKVEIGLPMFGQICPRHHSLH
jgi:Na+/H+ antiporter NhaD/arsenite permease-like protein